MLRDFLDSRLPPTPSVFATLRRDYGFGLTGAKAQSHQGTECASAHICPEPHHPTPSVRVDKVF